MIGTQRGAASSYLVSSLFPWGNTPIPRIWTPAYRLAGFSEGESVTTWTDFSGNNLSSQGGVHPGLYSVVGSPNGNPFISFNGVNQFYTVADLSTLTEATLFIVFKNTNPVQGHFIFNFTDITACLALLPLINDGGIYDGAFSTVRKDAIFGGDFSAGWHLYEMSSKNGLWTNWFNKIEMFSTNSSVFSAPANAQICASGGGFYSGNIADVIVFDSYLSESDRIKVENWVASQYGV